MSDDVFDNPTEGEGNESVFDALVGEDKKFKTPEDLARGKKESDAFIARLEDENKIIKEEYEKLKQQIGSKDEQTNLIDEIRGAVKGAEGSGNQPTDKEALEKLVRDIMQGETVKATAEQNLSKGQELVLKLANGDVDAARKIVAERAEAVGMTPNDLRELSKTSPTAFAKLIEDAPKSSTGSTQSISGTNTAAQVGSSNRPEEVDGVKTKAYFDRVRKEMGNWKFLNDKKLQREYLDAGIKLGDRFNV